MADLRSIPQRLQIPIPSGGSRAPSLEISSIKATTTPLSIPMKHPPSYFYCKSALKSCTVRQCLTGTFMRTGSNRCFNQQIVFGKVSEFNCEKRTLADENAVNHLIPI
jgi:hypothetical protein